MNAGTAGYLLAQVIIYGLVTRVLLFIFARKNKTPKRIAIIHAVFLCLMGSQAFRDGAYPLVALGFVLGFALWVPFDIYRARRTRATAPGL